jgi:cell division protein FtsZ
MDAANGAISSPLLEDASVKGARGVIINVTGGPDLSLIEVSEASAIIQEAAHEDANIIFGAVVDPKMEGRVKITVIATGFDRVAPARPAPGVTETPVDLHNYTAWRTEQVTEKVAAAGGGASTPLPNITRLSAVRRPVLEMPIAVSAGDPSVETAMPGAEFEPVSPLDVPAFLRRQNEA